MLTQTVTRALDHFEDPEALRQNTTPCKKSTYLKMSHEMTFTQLTKLYLLVRISVDNIQLYGIWPGKLILMY